MANQVCSFCGAVFPRYNISAARAARPQFCSKECRSLDYRTRSIKDLKTRFNDRVAVSGPDDCWEWTGRRDPNGYGRLDARLIFGQRARPYLAHRISYMLTNGPISEQLSVCHKCDNPPCCNPNHLFLGTQTENNADMDSKGRRTLPKVRRGSDINTSRLSEHQVLEILASKLSNKELAGKYGVSGTAIGKIRKGENWSHIHKRFCHAPP